jgi:hypothetical protein
MRFLLHVCFNPATEGIPKSCTCRHHISKTERDARLAAGELLVLDKRNVVEKRRVAPGKIFKRPPRATTIGHTQIGHAYIDGNRYEQRRIEIYREV